VGRGLNLIPGRNLGRAGLLADVAVGRSIDLKPAWGRRTSAPEVAIEWGPPGKAKGVRAGIPSSQGARKKVSWIGQPNSQQWLTCLNRESCHMERAV